MKRAFDLAVAFFGLLLLSPLILLISLAVLLTMGWPIFYCQPRVGRWGMPFKIIKFRSMVENADRLGPDLTTGGDRRITPLGKWLRWTKIDELPQLINVLVGEMSLVGPRPEVLRFVEQYSDEQKRVLAVRPGLTDPASIIYRDEEKILARYPDTERAYVDKIMPAKLKLNLAYIDRATFGGDLGILFKTFQKLFHRR